MADNPRPPDRDFVAEAEALEELQHKLIMQRGTPDWCEIHQSHKPCGHNGGVRAEDGSWRWPDGR